MKRFVGHQLPDASLVERRLHRPARLPAGEVDHGPRRRCDRQTVPHAHVPSIDRGDAVDVYTQRPTGVAAGDRHRDLGRRRRHQAPERGGRPVAEHAVIAAVEQSRCLQCPGLQRRMTDCEHRWKDAVQRAGFDPVGDRSASDSHLRQL